MDLTNSGYIDQARLRLEGLIEINQTLLVSVDPEESLRIILNSAIRLFSAGACSIAVVDADNHQLVFAFSAGEATVEEVRIDLGQGIAGWVVQTGEGVVCNDVSMDPRFFDGVDRKTGFTTKSLMCAPLNQQGQINGVIEILNTRNPSGFNKDDLKLLTVFGGLAATAINRARLFTTICNVNTVCQEVLQERYRFITGSSPAMQDVLDLARTVAPASTTVLLLGESGTGKEVMARYLHHWSTREPNPFIAVNCVALTPELMESELFGHEKGAFTGAIAQKKGRFELADGGTIFLDEIGELSLNLQTKLLRVLQEREFQRVGGTRDIRVNVRIIAATNRNLRQAVKNGTFREDFYYRLNVVSITMPPLRDRREDIPALAQHFIGWHCQEIKRPKLAIDLPVMDLLKSYPWPGNVRELQNTIERAVVLCHGTRITETDMPAEIRFQAPSHQDANSQIPGLDECLPMAEAMEHFKRILIRKTLERVEGNQAEAAKVLGLERSNLSRMMKRLGLR